MPKLRHSLGLVTLLAIAALVWRPGLGAPRLDVAADPLAYRDQFTNPYWPSIHSPKLTTPQWIGEKGVLAAAVLSIDDMRGVETYQSFLEPILQRLEKIDGSAPLSIFTNQIDPNEPQLQRWLERGLSIEVHTIDHPCPLLKDGDFDKARETVHRCVDLLDGIPNMRPVAYRMPCCDSMNSVSPRFYEDIMGAVTPAGNFLTSDSSVFQVFTQDDPELPRSLFADGNDARFKRYLPLGKDFVNTIQNYPYPYIIGKQHWQFPCTVPSDWEAQYLQGVNNQRTVDDLKAALDATVAKQGLFVLVFHPHGWIENEQVVQLIDHAQKAHGSKLKFLNMRDVQERIDRHLLDSRPIRATDGSLSGTQVVDVNGDGFMDVVFADGSARLWMPETQGWQAYEKARVPSPKLPLLEGEFAHKDALRYWDLDADGDLDAVYSDAEHFVFYRQTAGKLEILREGSHGANEKTPPPFLRADGSNNGVWMDRKSFIIQNEDTATEPNVIKRVPFKEVFVAVDSNDAEMLAVRPLDAEEALASMRTRPDLEIQLAVHEPLVMDPIDLSWGPDGKLWVVEMADYPTGTEGGRVRCLEDVDRDGRYEKSTIFHEGIHYPMAVKAWRQGALILASPDLFYAQDTDKDGRADSFETLYTGFSEGNQQHRINGLRWGLDNWLYLANGDSGGNIRSVKTGETVALGSNDLRVRPDEGLIELIAGSTQFGRNRNDEGDWFGNNNSNPLWHYVLDQVALKRNPHFSPPSGIVHMPAVPGNAPVFPASVTYERFNDFHTANCITSACGSMIYRAGLLGDAYRGNALIAEPVHNLVHRQVVTSQGVTFSSKRAEDEQSSEFLASTDPWFRPVSMHTAPDGALWVVDMYRQVIEHPEWIPHDWESRLDLRAGHERGRLYRIAPRGNVARPAPEMTGMNATDLVALLGNDSGEARDLAQQWILWERPEGIESALYEALVAPDWRHRLHVLATLDGLGKIARPMVEQALRDVHPGVRRFAMKLAAGMKGAWQFPEERDPKVLLEKAVTLGEVASSGRELAALALSTNDKYIQAACVSSMLADTEGFVSRLIETTFVEEHAPLLRWVIATAGKEVIVPHLSEAAELAAWRLDLVREALPGLRDEVRPLLVKAWEIALNELQSPALRVAALECVAAAGDMLEGVADLGAFCQPKEPLELQMAAIRLIGKHFPQEATDWLIARWPELEPALRKEVVSWLSGRPLEALKIFKHDGIGSIPDLVRSLASHPDSSVREAAAKILPVMSDGVMEARREEALALKGQRERGKHLFQQSCSICHVLEGEGNAIGPDLATLSNPSPDFLLEAILNPNAAVEDKYLAYVAETTDGAATIGLLEGESGAAVRLRLANGDAQELLRSEIRRVASTGRSLMPEGLGAEMSAQDMADLVAYVRSARTPRKSFPFNEPARVLPDTDGKIILAATKASVHGPSLVFDSRYLHLTNWAHLQDQAVWTFTCSVPGTYAIAVDFSCGDEASGDSLALEVNGEQRQTFTVPGTGNWNGFRSAEAGRVQLTEGAHELVARAAGPINGFLMDFRSVTLTREP